MDAETEFESDHKVEEYVFCLPEVQTLLDRRPNGSQQAVDFIGRNPAAVQSPESNSVSQTRGSDDLFA